MTGEANGLRDELVEAFRGLEYRAMRMGVRAIPEDYVREAAPLIEARIEAATAQAKGDVERLQADAWDAGYAWNRPRYRRTDAAIGNPYRDRAGTP